MILSENEFTNISQFLLAPLLTSANKCVITYIEQIKQRQRCRTVYKEAIDMMRNIFGEDLFDAFFEDFARPAIKPAKQAAALDVMKTDVKESENGYELSMELPGYKKEDISAELKEGTLIISAVKSSETEEKDKNDKFIRKERYYGNLSRSFYVGENVEETDIKAKFEDGVLTLVVPKKEAKPAVEERKLIAIEG